MKSLALLTLAALGLVACEDPTKPSSPADEPAPALAAAPQSPKFIPGQYIVVFRKGGPDVSTLARGLADKHRGKVRRTYQAALKGMAVELSDSAAAALRRDPAVEHVEQNQVVHAISEPIVQPGATMGLDRIDQRLLPLDGSYTYAADGTGVRVYILDTGINFGHSDFGGRAQLGIDLAWDGGTGGTDCNGHGTHVAGTVGGATYGVAKKVRLYSVRVLDCGGRGDLFSVLDGVEWVTRSGGLPAVANMSLGGGYSFALNGAVTNSIASGITYVVAAGNNGLDACSYSPSSVSRAIVVGATERNDALAWFSNRGDCVDLHAPGVNITSAWIGGTSAFNTISGTSMAAPHVAGAAALYLSLVPGASPVGVGGVLTNNATRDALTSVPVGTKNLLLYTGLIRPRGWEPGTSLPQPRRDLALVNANGLIYAIGGVTSTGTVGSMVAHNPSAGSWTSRASLPAARQGTSGAAFIGNQIYVPGGFNRSGALTRTLYAWDYRTNTWSSKAPIPVTSGCGLSGEFGGKLYVFTGCTGSTAAPAGLLHRYDPVTNTWTARRSAPHSHRYPAGGMINGKLYVVGGNSGSSLATATLHVYDPATNTWTTKASMPTARRGGAAGAVILGTGMLYVIGGRNAAGAYISTVEAYNPATNTWVTKPSLAAPRSGLGAVEHWLGLYAIGGRNSTTPLATTEKYQP
jgi:aqualysin 1